jgi:hypothetical protein
MARAPTLALPTWRTMARAMHAAISVINRTRSVICGDYGEGTPTIDDDQISFNGNLLGRYWWRETHLGRMIPGLENDDAHENFQFDRCTTPTGHPYTHFQLTTAGKPYTIAVRCALLLARHCFPMETLITNAPGRMETWRPAWEIAESCIGGLVLPPECKPHITLIDMHPSIIKLRPLHREPV